MNKTKLGKEVDLVISADTQEKLNKMTAHLEKSGLKGSFIRSNRFTGKSAAKKNSIDGVPLVKGYYKKKPYRNEFSKFKSEIALLPVTEVDSKGVNVRKQFNPVSIIYASGRALDMFAVKRSNIKPKLSTIPSSKKVINKSIQDILDVLPKSSNK